MLTFTNEDAKAAVQGNGGKVDGSFDFQPFPELEAAVKRDVEFLTDHESFPEGVAVSGWIYDVTSGKVGRIV
jgi:carbonic anhydrase